MNSPNKYTNLGIFFGFTGIVLTFAIIIYTSLKTKEGSFSSILPILFGLLPFTSTIPFIIGLVYSIKGRKEPNTIRKYIGFIINCGGTIIIIGVLIKILAEHNFFGF